jgi:hypothetical protein
MSGTLLTAEMTEIKHVSNFKKLNHSLPLCQNIVNGIYVPDLTENLLSVKRLPKTGHSVGFTEEQCEISKNNIVIATGKLSPDMYELRVPHRSLAVKQNQHTPNCQHSWHRRFGHRHPEDVQNLEIKKMATGLRIQDCGIREVCECCRYQRKNVKMSNSEESYNQSNIRSRVSSHRPLWTHAERNTKWKKVLYDND